MIPFRFWLLIFVLGVLGGCAPQREAPQASATGSQKPAQFPRDDLNREIKLQKPAQRIACIGPGATETIYALGAGNKLVGRDQISDYPAATKTVPVVGDYTGPFVEKVIAQKPDLVIVQGETYDKTRAENWQQKIGAPVAILVPTSVVKVARGMEKIGAWLGAPTAAKPIMQMLLRQHSSLDLALPVFVEVSRNPLWTAGQGTLLDDVIQRADLINCAHVKGYKQYSLESLIASPPDIYIVPVTGKKRDAIIQGLRADPNLKKLDCIRRGAIIAINGDLILRPGPRLVEGIERLRSTALKINRR